MNIPYFDLSPSKGSGRCDIVDVSRGPTLGSINKYPCGGPAAYVIAHDLTIGGNTIRQQVCLAHAPRCEKCAAELGRENAPVATEARYRSRGSTAAALLCEKHAAEHDRLLAGMEERLTEMFRRDSAFSYLDMDLLEQIRSIPEVEVLARSFVIDNRKMVYTGPLPRTNAEGLLVSLAKWALIAGCLAPVEFGRGTCWLCLLYNHARTPEGQACRGCPVYAATREDHCIGTPFQAFCKEQFQPGKLAHAQRELRFLLDLYQAEVAVLARAEAVL